MNSMRWLQIDIAVKSTAEFLSLPKAVQADLYNLEVLCGRQMNGGRISGAKSWSRARWRTTINSTQQGIERLVALGLCSWDEQDLLVATYNANGEVLARKASEKATILNRIRWNQEHAKLNRAKEYSEAALAQELDSKPSESNKTGHPARSPVRNAVRSPVRNAARSPVRNPQDMTGQDRTGQKEDLDPPPPPPPTDAAPSPGGGGFALSGPKTPKASVTITQVAVATAERLWEAYPKQDPLWYGPTTVALSVLFAKFDPAEHAAIGDAIIARLKHELKHHRQFTRGEGYEPKPQNWVARLQEKDLRKHKPMAKAPPPAATNEEEKPEVKALPFERLRELRAGGMSKAEAQAIVDKEFPA